MADLIIHQFPCLKDNYGFLIHAPDSGDTVAIDTPDAAEIQRQLDARGWSLSAIWNTHWHPDHVGGNLALKELTQCKVFGPAAEADRIPGMDVKLVEGDTVPLGGTSATVIETGGHTLGHIVFHFKDQDIVFVGDTLFALGCGRLFEGTPAQMWRSLSKLMDLPEETIVYCAHEYTEANADFALTVDGDNPALKAYAEEVRSLRRTHAPTVPTTIGQELSANPFLRARDPDIQAAMGFAGDPVATFAEIRTRKDRA